MLCSLPGLICVVFVFLEQILAALKNILFQGMP
jgi:hypothetical protein